MSRQTLVVAMRENVTRDQAQRIKDGLSAELPDVNVVVLGGVESLAVLGSPNPPPATVISVDTDITPEQAQRIKDALERHDRRVGR